MTAQKTDLSSWDTLHTVKHQYNKHRRRRRRRRHHRIVKPIIMLSLESYYILFSIYNGNQNQLTGDLNKDNGLFSCKAVYPIHYPQRCFRYATVLALVMPPLV
jgi:hypothetical protein